MRLLLLRRRPVFIANILLHLQSYTITNITSTAFQLRPNFHMNFKPNRFSTLSNKAIIKASSSTKIMGKSDHRNKILENNNNSKINEDSLLWKWATHTDESYHDFDPEEAIQIKQALLQWYRTHRRKLPWRGDAGPFDGSTAGINATNKHSSNGRGTNSKKGGKKRKMSSSSSSSGTQDTKSRQKSIKSFFKKDTSSSLSSHEDLNTNREDAKKEQQQKQNQNIQNYEKAIPVTGYSVWVSEIMLQQTRVEAVIPYYLKCKSSWQVFWFAYYFTSRQRLLCSSLQFIIF